jgi:hypothetical protein
MESVLGDEHENHYKTGQERKPEKLLVPDQGFRTGQGKADSPMYLS